MALAIGIIGAAVAVGADAYAIVLDHKVRTLELTQCQQQLSLDSLQEETAKYLACMDIDGKEIVCNFDKST